MHSRILFVLPVTLLLSAALAFAQDRDLLQRVNDSSENTYSALRSFVCDEKIDRFRQCGLIVNRIDPELRLICDGEPCVFEPHQGDVVDEWKISREPMARLCNFWCSPSVQHNAYLNALTPIFEL